MINAEIMDINLYILNEQIPTSLLAAIASGLVLMGIKKNLETILMATELLILDNLLKIAERDYQRDLANGETTTKIIGQQRRKHF